MFDLIIIGGGPAGSAAAVYAARKRLKTLLVTEEFGGQSKVSAEIFNWLGSPMISGQGLADSFENHVKSYEDNEILTIKNSRVIGVDQKAFGFSVTIKNGESFNARSILVTTGSKRKSLTVDGASTYENKGVVYCASCDGPLFSGKEVAVIGGGNAGFETALQLLAYCKKVYLLHRNSEFKADEITVSKASSNPIFVPMLNADIKSVTGETFVTGLTYLDKNDNQVKSLNVEGIFVEIGQIPNTDFMNNIVKIDDIGRIEIDPWTQRTSIPGIWAAGDCTNIKYHQNNISAGDGVKALEDIYLWLYRN